MLGSVNVTLSFCLVITLIITNFFGTSGNKFLAEYRGQKNAESFILILKILIYAPITLLSLISLSIYMIWDNISSYFALPADMIIPILFFIYFRTSYVILRRVFYGAGLVKQYALNEIIADITMLFILIIVCFTYSNQFLLHCYITSYLIFTILSITTLYFKIPKILKNLKKDRKIEKKLVLSEFLKYGFISMVGTVASTGTGYISVLVIGVYLSSSQAGIYSLVITIVSILMFIPKLATQVLLPEFSKLFGENNKKDISILLRDSLKILVCLAFIICFLVFFFSDQILLFFGSDFKAGSLLLRLMLPSVFIRIISTPFVSFLSGTNFIIYPNIGGLIILFISILLWMILVPSFELIGIVIGYTVGILIGIGYQIYMAILKLKIEFSSFLNV